MSGSTEAAADEFEAGSLIIPMDLDYQDEGMFRAYGLVYELLRNGVPVRWAILPGKQYGEADFTASATDLATAAAIVDHGYRGGPWVVDALDAPDALPIVTAWQAMYPETTVHEASDEFSAEVARYLVVAPTIAMVADGNEDIARDYMLAAAIPDSALDPTWPDTSPDMLDIEELAGPTDTNHADGSLFDEDGDPVYCQLMSMHWGVGDAENNPEVVAEVREYLNHPTHFFAECQAVNAFENLVPHGFFLTPNGFEFADQPDAVDFLHMDSPFGQIDGPFETVGGSEPAYTLPVGDMYKAGDITMLTAEGTPEGIQDVWMTGFLDGQCPPDQHECGSYGKVSYLGGHRYSVDTPISANPDAQGTRMFLNSLFEAPCATVSGLPTIAVAAGAPDYTDVPQVTLKITYVNSGFVTALDAVLYDELPAGAEFVSASDGGQLMGNAVVWALGNLGPGESGDVEIEVELQAFGTYLNDARLDYRVGLNDLSLVSNETETLYDDEPPPSTTSGEGSGTGDTSGSDSSPTSTSGVDGTSGSSAAETDSSGGGEAAPSGCGCQTGAECSQWGTLALLGLLGLRRRSPRPTRRLRSRASVAMVLAVVGCGGDDTTADDASGSGSSGLTGLTATATTASDTGDPMKLDVASPTDSPFSPGGCEKIDFLFVIDSSESMKDHQTNLINSFPGFVEAMREAVSADDWHVMVVDSDAQWGGAECANACSTLGTCPDEPSFACSTPPPDLCDITIGAGEVAPYGEGASNAECGLASNVRYIGSGHADLEGAFACVAQVGVDGNSIERIADALMRSLEPDMVAEDGCNAGFLRDDAILVVTLITDEPDEASEGDPQAWFDNMVAYKNDDPGALVVLGLLPDGDADQPLCADPLAAPRLGALVDLVPAGVRASVCEPDYSPFLASAVSIIAEACEDFVPPG